MKQFIQDRCEIFQHLYFIEENVVHPVRIHFFRKIGKQNVGIAVFSVAVHIQFQTDDMVGPDAGIQKIPPEKFKKQIRFSASAQSGDDFDHPVMHTVFQFLEINGAFDIHNTSIK